ncbi:GNAT family N-acetyltransferase [Krasilnikovia sp. MM14-A1259]|uniref:GNAT family N-acetyltransferase n=1 Tax=Krasilnikovia sp. MM14-A1259 TaxID=3373539 RepID=UPI0037F14794
MAQVIFRSATRADVPAILALLDDDQISRSRQEVVAEGTDAACWAAFEAIDADPRNELIVADDGGTVVGTCQLTFIPSLSRRGAERMTIEAVRVRTELRGRGIGQAMMRWALDRARERGCGLAQLTTDKRRTDAHRFYAALGFTASHEGMKLAL